MESPTTDSFLFVIRVWSSPGRFRASARRVDSESAQVFHAPTELVAYLEQQARESRVGIPAQQHQGDEHGPDYDR